MMVVIRHHCYNFFATCLHRATLEHPRFWLSRNLGRSNVERPLHGGKRVRRTSVGDDGAPEQLKLGCEDEQRRQTVV